MTTRRSPAAMTANPLDPSPFPSYDAVTGQEARA